MKKILKKIYSLFSAILFDPFAKYYFFRGLISYTRNIIKYTRQSGKNTFTFSIKDMYYTTYDKFSSAGVTVGHYFFQDIWAAKKIFNEKTTEHVDIASRIDGFIAHLLAYCKVTYVDIRNLQSNVENLTFIQGSILDLPYKDNSVNSLSCLHVIEHIGLGRYGDDVDALGHIKAAKELVRVLAPGGKLYFGTPIGQEKLCFDAHRIFSPHTIVDMFGSLTLLEFSLIDDIGDKINYNASFEEALKCHYGCGLFIFTK